MYSPPSPLDVQPAAHQGGFKLAGQAGVMPRNTLSSAWPNMSPAPISPLPLKALDISLMATPAVMPCLPLLSPSATPFLGMAGFGSLASCGVGHSLEEVMSVATDPMSRHFIHLNAIDVEMDHDTMDALMEVEAEEARMAAPLAYGLPPAAHTGLAHFGPAAGVTASQFVHWPSAAPLRGPGSGLGAGKGVLLGGGVPQQQGCSAGVPLHGAMGVPVRPSSAASSDTAANSSPNSLRRSPSQQLSDSTQVIHSRPAARRESAGETCGRGQGAGASDGEAHQGGLSVAFLDENGYFDMTLKDAAEQLGVGVTTLKKLCRQSGLGRWPYRARCSLRNLRDKMREYFAMAPAEEREAADALMEQEFCRLARMNVGAIDDAFKQFRQAMFKLEFKARQQLEASRGGGAGTGGSRKRPHSAGAPAEGELSGVFHGDAAFRQQAMLHLRRLLHACSDGSH